MKKSCVSVLLAVAMMVSMLFGVTVIPTFAANTATLTVSDAAGEVGETVEISISISADSYVVNGDLDLNYDTAVLRYIPDSCSASAVMDGVYWAANEAQPGEVRLSFASGASVGITSAGTLFTAKFEIVDNYALETPLSLKVGPLRGCNGGDDFDVAATIKNGTVAIIGGINPPNPIDFLNMSNNYIAQGAENVTVNADGSWTLSGNVTLEPNLDVDIDEYPKIGLILSSTVDVRVTFVDGYANKTMHLENEWVNNPTRDGYFLASDGYNGLGDFGGIYTWNKFPMKDGNVANVQTIRIELAEQGTATLRALYMSDGSPVSTAAPTKTTVAVETTTTTTTTTTKVYPMTVSVETVDHVGTVAAGESVTLDITVSEIDAVCAIGFVVNYDPQLFVITDVTTHDRFMCVLNDTMPDGQYGFSYETYPVGDTSLAEGTVIASITFTALTDIDSGATVAVDSLGAFRIASGVIECTAVNGGVRIADAVTGDVTGDGKVDADDAVRLFYYINRMADSDDVLLDNADLNGDGKINLFDAARLFYTVNGLI